MNRFQIKLYYIILILLLIVISLSCEHDNQEKNILLLKKPNENSSKPKLLNYEQVIKKLAKKFNQKLGEKIKANEIFSFNEKPSFLMRDNNDFKNELSKKLMEELSAELINLGINTINEHEQNKNYFDIKNCDGLINKIAYDYLIDFSLDECVTNNNCLKASLKLSEDANYYLVVSDEFHLSRKTEMLYKSNAKVNEQRNKIFFNNFEKAAENMIEKFKCVLDNISTDITPITIIVGKTERTSPEIASKYYEKVTQNGIPQVTHKRWLKVVYNAKKQFDLEEFKQKNNEDLLETANVLLALDYNPSRHISIELISLNTIKLKKMLINDLFTIRPGIVLPYCALSAIISSDQPGSSFYKYENLFSKPNKIDLTFQITDSHTLITVNKLNKNEEIDIRIEQISSDGIIKILYPYDINIGVLTKENNKLKINSIKKDDKNNEKVYIIALYKNKIEKNTQFIQNDNKSLAIAYAREKETLTINEYQKIFNNLKHWEVFSE